MTDGLACETDAEDGETVIEAEEADSDSHPARMAMAAAAAIRLEGVIFIVKILHENGLQGKKE